MNFIRRFVLPIAGVVAIALLIAIVSPRAVQAVTAALVRDVDNPDREPVTTSYQRDLQDGWAQSACGVDVMYTVPSGKRLVIDYISINAYMQDNGQTPGFGLLGRLTNFFPVAVGKSNSGDYMYAASFPVKLYYEAGPVYACVFRDVTAGAATIRADVTGHLVDTQ